MCSCIAAVLSLLLSCPTAVLYTITALLGLTTSPRFNDKPPAPKAQSYLELQLQQYGITSVHLAILTAIGENFSIPVNTVADLRALETIGVVTDELLLSSGFNATEVQLYRSMLDSLAPVGGRGYVLDPLGGHRTHAEELNIEAIVTGWGFAKYAPLFTQHEVDVEVLGDLTREDLAAMGINAVGARLKILRRIDAYLSSNRTYF